MGASKSENAEHNRA